jgi:hypothetical protein
MDRRSSAPKNWLTSRKSTTFRCGRLGQLSIEVGHHLRWIRRRNTSLCLSGDFHNTARREASSALPLHSLWWLRPTAGAGNGYRRRIVWPKRRKIIEKTDERYSEVELHRLQGELLHASGDSSGAEECYFRAVDVARRQSAKAFELRASISLAHLWLEQVKRTEARDLLAPIYGWFTEGFDTPHLKEAKALLEKLATCARSASAWRESV